MSYLGSTRAAFVLWRPVLGLQRRRFGASRPSPRLSSAQAVKTTRGAGVSPAPSSRSWGGAAPPLAEQIGLRGDRTIAYLISYGPGGEQTTFYGPKARSPLTLRSMTNVKKAQNPRALVSQKFHAPCNAGSSEERSSPAYAWRYPPVVRMTCYRPIPAYRSTEVNPATGKRGLVFSSKHPQRLAEGLSLSVPCGRCIGCRLDRSRDWAVRCYHEAKLHGTNNCFVTLTYDDQHLPDDFSVSVEVHQDFIRRLRDHVGHAQTIRYLVGAEYTDHPLYPRPHYHYLLFNYRPDDLKPWSKSNDNQLYISKTIGKLWPNGFSTVGEVTYKSAAYVARYCMKKIGGDLAADHYTRIHPLTDKVVQVQPEFARMSLKPAIGSAWFDRFKSDYYPSDFCVIDGQRHPIPKYYTKRLAEEERRAVKIKRKLASNKNRADNTPARLRVREAVKLSQTSTLKGTLKG